MPSLADAVDGVEAAAVEARLQVQLVLQVIARTAVDADPVRDPRRRDDDRVEQRPIHAVERGRLVRLVDDAERRQEPSGADAEGVGELEIEMRLLHGELAFAVRSDQSVLDLDLGVELDPVREAVADVADDASEVDLVAPAARRLPVVDLAVAAERESVVPALAALDWTLGAGAPRQLVEQRLLARLALRAFGVDLLLEALDLLLELVELRILRVQRRGRGRNHCEEGNDPVGAHRGSSASSEV